MFIRRQRWRFLDARARSIKVWTLLIANWTSIKHRPQQTAVNPVPYGGRRDGIVNLLLLYSMRVIWNGKMAHHNGLLQHPPHSSSRKNWSNSNRSSLSGTSSSFFLSLRFLYHFATGHSPGIFSKHLLLSPKRKTAKGKHRPQMSETIESFSRFAKMRKKSS